MVCVLRLTNTLANYTDLESGGEGLRGCSFAGHGGGGVWLPSGNDPYLGGRLLALK